MNIKAKKNLYIEFGENNLTLAVGEYDDELNFKVLEKEVFQTSGYKGGEIINIEVSSNDLKKALENIEKKTSFIFKQANIISNFSDLESVNLCGFKKLNGNQVLSEDISFILNDLRKSIIENENNKSILHLFNTKYELDKKVIKNLPIGLYGQFYSHQLTFFLTNKNNIKNIESLLSRCNLRLNRIVVKSFVEGVRVINNDKNDTFNKIIIFKNKIHIISFLESSFCYFKKYKFGSDLIFQDILKVCSLNSETLNKVISNYNFENLPNMKDKFLDKNLFENQSFRKISLELFFNVALSRIEEINNIIFNQNRSLSLDIKKKPLYLCFQDEKLKNFQNIIKKKFRHVSNSDIKSEIKSEDIDYITISADLIGKGWVKEAIPLKLKKKSIISRIFSGIFE